MKKLFALIVLALIITSCELRGKGDPKIFADCVETRSPAWIASEVGKAGENKDRLYIALYLNEENKTSLYYTLATCWKENFADHINAVYFDWFVTRKTFSLVNLNYDVVGILSYSIILERHNLEHILYISGYYSDSDRWYVHNDNAGYILDEQRSGRLYINYYDSPQIYQVRSDWAYHLDQIVELTLAE